MAAATSRLRLVTTVCPLPRYPPQLVARSVHALDAFSGGRFTLGVGLGVELDLDPFGEPHDARTRAAMADEALDLITRWCNGETVTHAGPHYTSTGTQIASGPTQSPRVPVWVGGSSHPALRRAARWDGWVIGSIDETQTVTFPPENVANALAYLRSFGPHERFDVAVSGVTPGGSSGLAPAYAEAGATWWFESLFGLRGSHAEMLERVAAGPPR